VLSANPSSSSPPASLQVPTSNGARDVSVSPTNAQLISPDAPLELVLSTLSNKQHAGDWALHVAGITRLYALVVAEEESVEALTDLLDRGVARQIIESMTAFPRQEQIQLLGCGALWTLAITEDNEAALSDLGAVNAMLNALQNHTTSVAVATQASGGLRNLCVSTGNADSIGSSGGLEALVLTMRSHLGDSTIQQQCLGALASLALDANNKPRLLTLGFLDLLCTLLTQRFPDDAAVHQESLACLRNLCSGHRETKDLMGKQKLMQIVLNSARKFADLPLNQLHACGCMWNASANSPTNKVLLIQLGAVELILAAMQTHPESEEILTECCGTLRNCSSIVENRSALFEAGVLEAVIACAKRFPNAQVLMEQCCPLLFNMSDNDAFAKRIVELGGVQLLVDTASTYLDAATMAEECTGALWMLTRCPDAFTATRPQAVVELADRILARGSTATHPSHAGVEKTARGMRAAWAKAARSKANVK
jgi:hypothetical protein